MARSSSPLLLLLLAAVCLSSMARGAAASIDLTHPCKPIVPAELACTSMFEKPADVTFDVNKAALVVVDMQNFFLASPDAPGRALVAPLNATIAKCRERGIPIFWVNWGSRKDYLNFPETWRPPVEGTEEAKVWPGLDYQPDADIDVKKFRLTGFYRSELDDILRFMGLKTLFFAGVNTEQCVFGTVRDAEYLGYDAVVVTDLCATTSPDFASQDVLFNAPYSTTYQNLLQALS